MGYPSGATVNSWDALEKEFEETAPVAEVGTAVNAEEVTIEVAPEVEDK